MKIETFDGRNGHLPGWQAAEYAGCAGGVFRGCEAGIAGLGRAMDRGARCCWDWRQ